jgi:hypothetical protein
MVPIGAVEVRLNNHDARLESHHNALGDLRGKSATHTTEITVARTELRETREDLKEIREEIKWIRRGMWTAAAALVGFTLTLGGLLAAILSSG